MDKSFFSPEVSLPTTAKTKVMDYVVARSVHPVGLSKKVSLFRLLVPTMTIAVLLVGIFSYTLFRPEDRDLPLQETSLETLPVSTITQTESAQLDSDLASLEHVLDEIDQLG